MVARIVTVTAGGATLQFLFSVSNIQAAHVTEVNCFIAGRGFQVIIIIFNPEPMIAACLGSWWTVNAPFRLRTTGSALVSSPPPVAYVLNVCKSRGRWAQGGGVFGVEMSAH